MTQQRKSQVRTITQENRLIGYLYSKGYSAQEILDDTKFPYTVRTIHRRVASLGLTRSPGDAFRNAVKRGRVHFAKKESKIKQLSLSPLLRMKILERDNFTCQLCGATKDDRLLEVDHSDFDTRNNNESNLRVLCEFCNFGRRQTI
ncbi:MAG: HNH endonuclease [Rhabdochlamydiaceae bacterium]